MITAANESRAQTREPELAPAAAFTGAIPMPLVSLGIVAENAAMITVVASEMGVPVSVETVVTSIGVAGVVNAVGRAASVEAARRIGWAGNLGGIAAVCALGATTAAVQT
jgi:hypothetical protein